MGTPAKKKGTLSVGEIVQKALTRGEKWNKTTFEKKRGRKNVHR